VPPDIESYINSCVFNG